MILRDAAERDLAAIVRIYNQAILARTSTAQIEPVRVDDRRAWFNAHTSEDHPLWIAENEGSLAGWLSLQPFLPRCAYAGTAEVSVYVDEKARRRGVARALLEQAIARSPQLGLTALAGHIFAHNGASLELFRRCGFEQWGRLPRIARLDGVECDLVIVGRHCGRAE